MREVDDDEVEAGMTPDTRVRTLRASADEDYGDTALTLEEWKERQFRPGVARPKPVTCICAECRPA